MLTTILTLLALAGPVDPAGLELHGSECASGGFDYYFFAGGKVISRCWGCVEQPRVQEGTWRLDGSAFVVTMTREWVGLGRGAPIGAASVDLYAAYAASVRPVAVARQTQTLDPGDFDETRGCASIRRHARAPDPRAFLRLFDGRHPETFQRVLDPAELRRRGAAELRLTRNEIFARYGLRFRDPSLLDHFRKEPRYEPTLVNVDAFLSDVELQNVGLLADAEREASSREPPAPTRRP